jgi:hypothetical protein
MSARSIAGVGDDRLAWAVKSDWLQGETMPEANKLGVFIAVVRHYLVKPT